MSLEQIHIAGMRGNQSSSKSTLSPMLDFLSESLGCGGPQCVLADLKGWKWIGRGGIFLGWRFSME